MATAKRIDMLKEIYPDDTIERIENSTVHARVNGRRAYITNPTTQLSVRHELVADLAATGMKPVDIARTLKKDPTTLSGSGHYNMLLRDPRIRQAVKDKVGDALNVAKDNLRNSVIRASENVTNAVNSGDLKMSQYVLGTQGLTEKPKETTQANVTLDFGSWLSSVSNTKDMHEIPAQSAEVICDSSALPAPIDGEIL